MHALFSCVMRKRRQHFFLPFYCYFENMRGNKQEAHKHTPGQRSRLHEMLLALVAELIPVVLQRLDGRVAAVLIQLCAAVRLPV